MSGFTGPGTPFHAYGASHVAVLLTLLALAPLVVLLGRWVRGGRHEQSVCRAFAVLILAVEIPIQIFSMLPAQFVLGDSLPFHLCDLAWMIAAVALWSRAGWATGLVYYWGLTLTMQALLTPHLEEDFPHWQFISFFMGHGLIVLAALFLTIGLGVRPSWRLLRGTIAITLGWAAVMFVFNALAGTNYLYLMHKPPTASAFDLMGPWPQYLFVAFAIGVTVWSLITAPWYIPLPRGWGLAASQSAKTR